MALTPLSPVQIPPELRVSAAERLVQTQNRRQAAEKLVANAHAHGIDLSLLWGAVGEHEGSPFVRQVVMGVPSAGRTGMLFLSPPRHEPKFGNGATQTLELASCIRAAVEAIPTTAPTSIRLCQALIETGHTWADHACRDAGMTWVGRLQFMRSPWPVRMSGVDEDWPQGVAVRSVIDPNDFTPGRCGDLLVRALEGTYEDTKDCPELCGLRTTRDVIASHMSTGAFDPARWWILEVNGQPEGCCLLNHCPASRSIELVYIGLSPRARGRGLGKRLLAHALRNASVPGVREITCAVDTRNTPALKLYHDLGFRAFAARVGFVHATRDALVEIKRDTQPEKSPAGGSIGTSGGQEKVTHAKRL